MGKLQVSSRILGFRQVSVDIRSEMTWIVRGGPLPLLELAGQTHFKMRDDYALKGHGFSRALSKPLRFTIAISNAFALLELVIGIDRRPDFP